MSSRLMKNTTHNSSVTRVRPSLNRCSTGIPGQFRFMHDELRRRRERRLRVDEPEQFGDALHWRAR